MADFRLNPYKPEIPLLTDRWGNQSAGKQQEPAATSSRPEEISFRDSIRNFVHDVDGMQKDSVQKMQDFIAGEISDVHDVMIAAEKAGTSFQLLMELRNKMMDAYNEIKHMSV